MSWGIVYVVVVVVCCVIVYVACVLLFVYKHVGVLFCGLVS